MGDRLRVLSVSSADTFGGAARAAYRIHCAVKDMGIESTMLVKYKGSNDADVLAVESFLPNNPFWQAYYWALNKYKNKKQHFEWRTYTNCSKYLLSDLRSTDIHGALRKLDYDILHLHWINQRFLPLEELPKDKPMVWTLHDSWPFCGVCHLPMECRRYQQECGCCPALGSGDKRDLSYKVWKRKAEIYKQLDLHIVAPSRWMADCARKSSLFGDCDIRVIPNCIDVDVFCPGDRVEACRQLHLDAEKRFILFAAMNAVKDKNKGFDFLISALNSMGEELAEDMELVVLGTSDTLPEEIGGLRVRSLGLLRSMSEMVSAYRVASVTVVPSLSENLSCTVMESMSCGTPVIAFDIGGNGDMIDHQINGYLAKGMDSAELAEGVCWCLDNNKSGDLSAKARWKILERFTPEIVASQYSLLYRGLER